MSSRLRKPTFIVLALFAVIALGACGDSHTRVTTGTYAGESGANAPYLDVGQLVYEVQLSRELSPYNTEDSNYLQGLPADERKLEAGEEWFGVFVQVYNNSSHPLTAASQMTISDTQGNVYTPVELETGNQFAYRAGSIPPQGRIPELDTIAAEGPIQGSLLLFKIHTVSLDNRPLKLKIVDPENPAESASAELDV
jgi:hypothetical protein